MKCADIALGLAVETNINLFFALIPDEDAIARIVAHGDAACGALTVGGSRIRPEHLHLTLLSFHDRTFNADVAITKASTAAGRIRLPPLPIPLDLARGVDVQRGRYPFVLQCSEKHAGITALRRLLGREMLREGLIVAKPTAPPHVTEAWGARLVDEEFPLDPILWTARAFVLVESHVGKTQHFHRGRWPLKG